MEGGLIMDLPRAFMKCRPEATFENNSVNFFSLETANECYIGEDKVAQAELDVAWLDIKAEDVIAASNAVVLEQIAETEKDDRLAEDMLDLLVSKGVFTEDELPQKAKDKINTRRNLRGQLQ